MTAHSSLLAQGIAAAKAGDKSTARQLLSRAVQGDPNSEASWLWLSSVMETPQGKTFCLHRVLALNPANQAAQRGLAALAAMTPAPTLLAPPLPSGAGSVASPPALSWPVRRTWFWQVLVMCLAVVALGLVAVTAYAVLSASGPPDDEVLAAIAPSSTPAPQGTLRATFTATPTETPTATPTSTPMPTLMPTATATPSPVPTATWTPVPTRRVRRPTPTAPPPPTAVARFAPPPRSLDPRLAGLGVRLEPAGVGVGQPYWRLLEARWTDERQSGGKHSIYVEVLDGEGRRAVGQPVIVHWSGGNVILPVRDVPAPDWAVNFPMYNCLGSYAISVGGAPSDRLVGLGLGTAETPNFTIHTSFYLTFRLVQR